MRLCWLLVAVPCALGCAEQEDEPACEELPCLDEVGALCTVAGTGVGGFAGDGGSALEAELSLPFDVAFAPDGTPVIVDFNNLRIRAIDRETGVISTVVGTGALGGLDDTCSGDPAVGDDALELCLNHASGVAFDPGGQMLIAGWHNSQVFRVDLESGTVTGVFGTGRRAYEGDGGPAEAATFDTVPAVAPAADGSLFVMDQQNQVIRVIDADGTIARYAGNCVVDRTWDGEALCAEGEEPAPCPGSDKLACGDLDESCARPCSIDFEGGTALEMRMAQAFGGPVEPTGQLALAPDGTLYFSDPLNFRVRSISPGGTVTTVAGSGEMGYAGDGGPATTAQLTTPGDLALADDGTLFIADPRANCVRRVARDGTIDTVVGVCGGERGLTEDGFPAIVADLRLPYGVAVAGPILYVAETGNHVIRAVRLE